MSLTVNGNKIDWVKEETITNLLRRMNYIFPMIIVKVNGSVIKRKEFTSTIIDDHSVIDVIHLISGG